MKREIKKCLNAKLGPKINITIPKTVGKIERLIFLDPDNFKPLEIFNRNVIESVVIVTQMKTKKLNFISVIKQEWMLVEWDKKDLGEIEDKIGKLSPDIQEKYEFFLSLIKDQVVYLKKKCKSMEKILALP